ncbi:hypothetical protein O9929_25925 [Vibrio lentus]|nr:hypothetical protein [Vibrio lentus]
MGTVEKHKRTMPGRVIGVSIGYHGTVSATYTAMQLVSTTSAARKRHRTSVQPANLANMASSTRFTTVQKAYVPLLVVHTT